MAVADHNGPNPDDPELLVTIRKRVGACMCKVKQVGYARKVPIAGELRGGLGLNSDKIGVLLDARP